MIIVIGSNKGGVGKTTLATNLAVAFAIRMNKTVLVDADPQGSALYWGSVRQQKKNTHHLFMSHSDEETLSTL